MRITFVDNLLVYQQAGKTTFDLQPHLGLISLIAVLENEGHDCTLFDPKLQLHRKQLPFDDRLYSEMARAILRDEPDVIGFTSLGCNFICTAQVASLIRKWKPKIPIILGGPHATILDCKILERFDAFDVIVRNEGEEIITPLINALASDHDPEINGITFRRENEIVRMPPGANIENLDLLPFPAYDAYPIKELGLKSIRIEAGRGCPFNCTFCSTASFFGRSYRIKSPAKLRSDLLKMSTEYGINDFALTHDLFTVNKRMVGAFCDQVSQDRVSWTCSARMDCVDKELLQKMKYAGCRSIYYGVETGSARMQSITKKRLDVELFGPILEHTHAVGIHAITSFITGYPEETEEDQRCTLNLIGQAFKYDEKEVQVQLHLLTPEPGTQLMDAYEHAIDFDGYVTDFNFPTLGDDDELIMTSNPEVFMNHHFFPSSVQRDRNIWVVELVAHLRKIGHKLLDWIIDEEYSGRFSELVDDFLRSNPKRITGRIEIEEVTQFFAKRLANCPLLADVVKYLLLVHEVPFTPVVDSSDHKRDDEFQISPSAKYFQDIYNIPSFLQILSTADVDIALSNTPNRKVQLLAVKSSPAGECRNFVLDSEASKLFEYAFSSRGSFTLEGLSQLTRHFGDLHATIQALFQIGVFVRKESGDTRSFRSNQPTMMPQHEC
jgi:radical SAM superfamily enzyme YgiQ (UPF0313 family)